MPTAREIEVCHQRIAGVAATLVAMLSPDGSGPITRALHLAVLAMLRPAESAMRRLIAMMASGMTVAPVARKAPPAAPVPKSKGGTRAPSFPLFDPRIDPDRATGKRRRKKAAVDPWAGVIGVDERVSAPVPRAPSPEDEVAARMVRRRLAALLHALADPARQARRLARKLASGRSRWLRVMRPGRPPGHREGGTREVDEVLRDCHWFALEALRMEASREVEKVPP